MKKILILLAAFVAISASSYGFSDTQWSSGGYYTFTYQPNKAKINYYLCAYNTVGRNIITASIIIDPVGSPAKTYSVVSYNSMKEKSGSYYSFFGYQSVVIIHNIPLDTKGWIQTTISW